ncbi:MAG TPA: DNA polymerase IV [Myxococcota bacterium]|nr:DNA polymerase IV [Myxococcota bacterium]
MSETRAWLRDRQERVIAHADMDAFYASVEQRDRPELRGRPVVVGGASRRGVVASASYEARRFGVRSAMPGIEARQRCPDAIFIAGDMKRYARESRRIFEIFRRFAPRVEGLSLDEAFLDLTGTERLLGPAAEVAKRLRAAVHQETGLVVSVGIAPVKLVAKIASDLAKPDGLIEVRSGEVEAFLAPLPVGRLWGVGPVTEARLVAAGYRTVGDLARADVAGLRPVLGDWGAAFARLAQGRDLRDVEPFREAISLSEESTFEYDVADRAVLETTLLVHAESVARRLRKEGLVARTVVLKLKLGRRRAPGPRGFALLTRRETLAHGTDDGEAIARVARALLARTELQEAVRLLGVGVTNLASTSSRQLGLFSPVEPEDRRMRLNQAVDALAARFGPGTVTRAGVTGVARAGLSHQIKRGETE